MNRKISQRGLGIGVVLALGTTAVAGVVLAMGAPWLQWLGIASLLLLGEGVVLAIMSYRGPRVPRTRISQPMTLHDVYVFEEGWHQQTEEEGWHQPGETGGRISRYGLGLALPPLVLGAILFVVSVAG